MNRCASRVLPMGMRNLVRVATVVVAVTTWLAGVAPASAEVPFAFGVRVLGSTLTGPGWPVSALTGAAVTVSVDLQSSSAVVARPLQVDETVPVSGPPTCPCAYLAAGSPLPAGGGGSSGVWVPLHRVSGTAEAGRWTGTVTLVGAQAGVWQLASLQVPLVVGDGADASVIPQTVQVMRGNPVNVRAADWLVLRLRAVTPVPARKGQAVTYEISARTARGRRPVAALRLLTGYAFDYVSSGDVAARTDSRGSVRVTVRAMFAVPYGVVRVDRVLNGRIVQSYTSRARWVR